MSDERLEVAGLAISRKRAISVLQQKLATMRRVLRDGGTRGILLVLKRKAASFMQPVGLRNLRTAVQLWCGQEHWWVGLLVAGTGNVVRVESCTFLVSHPAIPTSAKSLFLLGGYERAERAMIKAHLDRSGPVVELGGSVGVVACVTNRLLTDPRKHVVVEANPDLISVLTANRDRNGCGFTVLNRALAYVTGSTTFYVNDTDFLASSVQLKTAHGRQVPAVSLAGIIEEFGFDTCSLVCDIEGGEIEMVRHEAQVLQDHVAMIIVEVHWWVGHEQCAEMIGTLERIGFRCLHEKDATYVFRNERLHLETAGTIAH